MNLIFFVLQRNRKLCGFLSALIYFNAEVKSNLIRWFLCIGLCKNFILQLFFPCKVICKSTLTL